ncbi:peptidoglycan-associated lipoprotein Pal [Paraburkholderia aromaticivorans]|uniref:peptidoglycan-associated lipoprotein Pal n=1 Tax=Paraburkholderia aromaticivorans TaxID=2026199 RepID=UPI0038BBE8E3
MTKTGLCILALLVGTLAGCHSGAKLNQNSGPQGNAATSQATNAAPLVVDELNDPNGPLAKRSVYFDFDSYTVKSDYQPLLEAHAQYLRSHPGRHVLIQGNTDERGTSEYNLALGERRSQAVLHDLETLGVPDSQLEAVSFGKEKPIALGHDEASWAQNRRADMVYR